MPRVDMGYHKQGHNQTIKLPKQFPNKSATHSIIDHISEYSTKFRNKRLEKFKNDRHFSMRLASFCCIDVTYIYAQSLCIIENCWSY